MSASDHVRLNPAEARLRARLKSLEPVGVLAGHYKAQDEGGLAPLLAADAASRRGEARRGEMAARGKRRG